MASMGGKYVDFEKLPNGNLKLTLNDEGREELVDYLSNYPTIHDLMESQLCNGWDRVQPEEVGGLTGCDLIISDDVERDDDGDIVKVGGVYWHPNYAIEDPVETLRDTGSFVLTYVKGEDAPEETSECPKCGSELDKDCQGEMRCPECDPPCPSCSDGGMDLPHDEFGNYDPKGNF
jgi:hypothetical protein